MATPYITIGCPTTGGGQVISGNSMFLIDGIAVACVGDKATCPTHKVVATIVSGDPCMQIFGKAAARVNDSLSCGCKLLPKQNLVVQDNGGGTASATKSSSSPMSQKQQTTDSFREDKYENYYIEQYKTDVYISHKAVLLGDEGVTPLDGAVSYFLNYKVQGKELFLSVVINAAPLSHKGTVYPFGTAIVSREGKEIARTKLKKDKGYWPTDKNKAPLGSCTIKLPEPNLQLVDVELELGYTAVISDTVGSVHPIPPIKKYKFSLNSAARKV
ncbi:PAAR domain-containing protein [Acinetobacter calcoaceticus]|uniref:PAAR domain-containing protein n=1 Tax=Acinetobacter calcoaceticus TaxID=471 RepID=UPI0009B71D31|nr:PAAR domain-containing protein [Acinetobacter calcoaceticus]